MSYRIQLPDQFVSRDIDCGSVRGYWLPKGARGNYSVIWDNKDKENPDDEAIYFEFETEEEGVLFKLTYL